MDKKYNSVLEGVIYTIQSLRQTYRLSEYLKNHQEG